MAFMAKDKIVRTGEDLNLSTLVGIVNALGGEPITSNNRIEKIAVVDLTANPDDSDGGVLAWANPEGVPIVVTRLLVNISDASGGAGTINFGVAADATTASDTLIDGTDAEVAGFVCNIKNAGTNGKSAATMSATQFLTGTASAPLTTFAGTAYIHYVLA
jgi:hypothetical protein